MPLVTLGKPTVQKAMKLRTFFMGRGVFFNHFKCVLNATKGWLAIATLKPLVEREFLSTNEKP